MLTLAFSAVARPMVGAPGAAALRVSVVAVVFTAVAASDPLPPHAATRPVLISTTLRVMLALNFMCAPVARPAERTPCTLPDCKSMKPRTQLDDIAAIQAISCAGQVQPQPHFVMRAGF